MEDLQQKSCGGLSMTKDNRDDVDEVADALKTWDLLFKTSHGAMARSARVDGWVRGSVETDRGDRNNVNPQQFACVQKPVRLEDKNELI